MYFNLAYASTPYPFPKDNIDPSEKNELWCKQYTEAIYSLYVRKKCVISQDDVNEFAMHRLYGRAMQPVEKYIDWMEGTIEPQQPDRAGYMNINKKIISIAPKIIDVVVGKFEGLEYDIKASAIDASSCNEREQMMYDMWFDSQYKPIVKELELLAGLPESNTNTYLPQSLDELMMYKELGGFKMMSEVALEFAAETGFGLSDWPEIKRKMLRDMVEINCLGCMDYVDPVDGISKVKYIDPAGLILEYSPTFDYRNSSFGGHIEYMSIKDVRMNLPDVDEDKVKALAQMYCGKFGNPSSDDFQTYTGYNVTTGYGYDMFFIPVFHSRWLSLDTRYKTTRTKGNETKEFEEKGDRYGTVHNTAQRKTRVVTNWQLYGNSWVIGTEYNFGWGISNDIARPDLKTPRLPYHFKRLEGRSKMDLIEPKLDDIQLACMKLQNAIASSPPSGLMIEFGTLSNIALSGKDLKPRDLIRIYRQTGDIIYKATTHQGKYNSAGAPIQRIEGGIGNLLGENIQIIEHALQFISEIVGIDRVSFISNPGGQTATEVKEGISSTIDSLKPLYSAYSVVKESAAKNMCAVAQQLIKYKPDSYESYASIFGKPALEIFKIGKSPLAQRYAIQLEARPSEEQKAIVRNALMEAMKVGKNGTPGILPEDYMMVERYMQHGNYKLAEAILTVKRTQREKEQQQREDRNQEISMKGGIAATEAKSKAEKDKIILQGQIDVMVKFYEAKFEKEGADNELMNTFKELLLTQTMQPTAQPQPTQ